MAPANDHPGDVPHGPADRELLGLELVEPGDGSFDLTAPLSRLDGKLYGGTAVAAATAVAESATGRRALWITVQFVASADVGSVIRCRAEVLASGRRTSQVRVTGTVGDDLVFCALAATAHHKEGGLSGTFRPHPDVVPLDESRPFRLPFAAALRPEGERSGWERLIDLRVAREPAPAGDGEPFALWARATGHRSSPAVLGYLADFVPMGVATAAGRAGGGTSLDNTVRFGAPADTEWVLIELDPHLAVGGYGHGAAHLWSPEGQLLAVASQTASMMLFD